MSTTQPERRKSVMTSEDRDAIIAGVSEIILNSGDVAPLTNDERRWVRTAIQVQAKRAELVDAIIKKSLTALAWSAVVGCAIVFKEWLATKGLKL